MEKVNLLDTTVDKILVNHEKEFINAFRMHMGNVYKKLEELKILTEQ